MWTNSSAAVQMQDRPQGYFRNPDQDGDLLSKFGLSWWTEVDPVLDDEGRLSPRQAERLLMRLKEHEYIFDLALAKMPADEQEHQRSRYSLLKRFITQAISENTPIHTMM